MNQNNDTIKSKKWKHLSEKERYAIEALFKSDHNARQIAQSLNRDRRTIQREIKRGMVIKVTENPYVSRNPKVPDYLEKIVYSARKGQQRADKMKLLKGRGLKIGKDKKLLHYLETCIADNKFSPDAAIGQIKELGLQFPVMICTKTVYNMIDRGDFSRLTNKDLPVKRNKTKRKYKKISKIAKNNIKGRSIEQRSEQINKRQEKGHWEMDLVIGKGRCCLQVMTERAVSYTHLTLPTKLEV